METDFIVTVAALCLVQICLSIYCYKVWQQKEYWRKLYHESVENNNKLLNDLNRLVRLLEDIKEKTAKDMDDMYDQRMNDMISMTEGCDKTFDEEMGLWNKSKRPPIGDARSCMDDDNDF